MYVTLAQLYDSMHATNNTLNTDFINAYVKRNKTEPVFVTWNGETDKKILNKLNLEYVLLNITTYDVHLDNNYVIRLIDERNKTIIHESPVGTLDKPGRQLNLNETHTLMCGAKHEFSVELHDPCTDVILTKCIFDKLIRRIKYNNLVNYLTEEW